MSSKKKIEPPPVTNNERLKLLLPVLAIIIALLLPLFVHMARFKLPATFNQALYSRVYEVWFADLPRTPTPEGFKAAMKRWYAMDASQDEKAAFDRLCRHTVFDALESIGLQHYELPPAKGDYQDELNLAPTIARPFVEQLETIISDHGLGNASETALSMILMLDQMPRNIYRNNQGVIYSHYDRIARSLSRYALAEKLDRHQVVKDSAAHRWFFYMPFEHSEFVEDQRLIEEMITEVRNEAVRRDDKPSINFSNMGLEYAKKHKDIIEQFGRFPYRNKWLGRSSTEEEQRWIDGGGDTFGS